VTTPSRKASARRTKPEQAAAARAAQSRTASRAKAAGSSAIANAARRQFQKSEATAIQGHVRSSGQRKQARRDSR
jgi:hypothetical protein